MRLYTDVTDKICEGAGVEFVYEGTPASIALKALDDYERLGPQIATQQVRHGFNVARNAIKYSLTKMTNPVAEEIYQLLDKGALVNEFRIAVHRNVKHAVTEDQLAETAKKWWHNVVSDFPLFLLTFRQWLEGEQNQNPCNMYVWLLQSATLQPTMARQSDSLARWKEM